MLHNYLSDDKSGDHWAVSGGTKDGNLVVLVQMQEEGRQARLALSAEQAEAMGEMLLRQSRWLKGLDGDRNTR